MSCQVKPKWLSNWSVKATSILLLAWKENKEKLGLWQLKYIVNKNPLKIWLTEWKNIWSPHFSKNLLHEIYKEF